MYPIKFFGFSGFLVLIVAECSVNTKVSFIDRNGLRILIVKNYIKKSKINIFSKKWICVIIWLKHMK